MTLHIFPIKAKCWKPPFCPSTYITHCFWIIHLHACPIWFWDSSSFVLKLHVSHITLLVSLFYWHHYFSSIEAQQLYQKWVLLPKLLNFNADTIPWNQDLLCKQGGFHSFAFLIVVATYSGKTAPGFLEWNNFFGSFPIYFLAWYWFGNALGYPSGWPALG